MDRKRAIVTMKQYLKEAIAESGMEITQDAATPARKCSLEVDDTCQTFLGLLTVHLDSSSQVIS